MFCWGDKMVLDLKRIFLVENEALTLQTEVEMPADIAGAAHFDGPVQADIQVANHAGLVEFTAEVSFAYRFDCDRCTQSVSRIFKYHFRHILVRVLSEESGDDYIEAPDDKLDTDALLRDDILLELPSKLLCKESCKGLCPKCGKNLNEGSCSCKLREADPRLAALRELLTES